MTKASNELRERILHHYGVKTQVEGEYVWHLNEEFSPAEVYALLADDKNLSLVKEKISGTIWAVQLKKLEEIYKS